MGCNGNDICISPTFDYSNVGITQAIPTTIFEFYDLHSHLMKSTRVEEADKMRDKFSTIYIVELPSQYKLFKNLIDVSKQAITENSWVDIQGTSVKAIGSSYKLINEYRLQLVNFLKKYDILWSISTNAKIMDYLNKIYKKLILPSPVTRDDINKIINDSTKPIADLYNLLSEYRNKINQDLNYVLQLSRDQPKFKNSYNYSRWLQLNNFLMMTSLPQ